METSNFLIANTHKNINHFEKIEELIKNSKQVRIICPFISKSKAERLVQYQTEERHIEVITEITRRGIATGVQLPSTLKILLEGGVKVSYIGGNLHSKIFWFDDDKILITSANLTNNGLENNFEIGVLFDKPCNPCLAKGIDFFKIHKRINNLWNDLKRKETSLSVKSLQYLLDIEAQTKEIRNKLLQHSDGDIGIKYAPSPKESDNLSQIDIDLEAGGLFKGFTQEDWSAFDHGFAEINKENVEKVKEILTKKIHPILQRFYEGLQFSRELPIKLEDFDRGYSLNRWVKNYFPNYRYLWLVRKRKDKNPIQHIGEPSLIIGIGKDEKKGNWFEIRAGVEELNEPKLTKFGRQFLLNIKQDISRTIDTLQSLGEGWFLTHENKIGETYSEIATKNISREILLNLIEAYLTDQRERIADIHIRRKYYLNDSSDAAILLSEKIIFNTANDMKSLLYFFDLAHKRI